MLAISCKRIIIGILTLTSRFAVADETCIAPTTLAEPAYDITPKDEKNSCLAKPIKKAPDFHMLVFSWSPGFCQSQRRPDGKIPSHLHFQCLENKFGWVVHGLWAELDTPESCIAESDNDKKPTLLHPRYCQGNLPQLPESLVKANMCMMPGSRLIQGEWEKHGACIFDEPSAYFAKIRELRNQIVLPNATMAQSQLFDWMRKHNPVLKGTRLDYNPKGNQLRICYSTHWKPINCPGKPAAPASSNGKQVRAPA